MSDLVYKIRNKEGLFYQNSYPQFNGVGKTWNTIGRAKQAMRYHRLHECEIVEFEIKETKKTFKMRNIDGKTNWIEFNQLPISEIISKSTENDVEI